MPRALVILELSSRILLTALTTINLKLIESLRVTNWRRLTNNDIHKNCEGTYSGTRAVRLLLPTNALKDLAEFTTCHICAVSCVKCPGLGLTSARFYFDYCAWNQAHSGSMALLLLRELTHISWIFPRRPS